MWQFYFSVFEERLYCFPQWIYQFTFPPTGQEGSLFQGNIQSHCKSLSKYQWHFHSLEQIILNFVWKHKRHQITKRIFRKKNRAGNITLPDFRLQSYSYQNRKVLAQKQTQTHRSMKQNREPRNKSTYLWSTNLQQRRQK